MSSEVELRSIKDRLKTAYWELIKGSGEQVIPAILRLRKELELAEKQQ